MERTPVLLMVSGGSDSMALLELAVEYVRGGSSVARNDEVIDMIATSLPEPEECALHVLHVNHMLRGEASDGDEGFVVTRCAELGVPCEVARVDIAALCEEGKGGMEAIAREERYRLARERLTRIYQEINATSGIILTAHTLDDRVETFYMRSLVGTGPGGLASIPRRRGVVRRPLLDATRNQLREWLRSRYPGKNDEELWREDESNYSGENFRSRLRISLIPVLQELRPGFERSLAQTMDLIADEDDALQQQVDSIVYRSLEWDGETAYLPIEAARSEGRPMARRVLRACLLVVNPDARLEAAQIDRILDNLANPGYSTDVSGGIRVVVCHESIQMSMA